MKSKEGCSAPERDSQFRYINEQVKDFIQQGDPVISVDTKKRENVGFVNVGISRDTSEFAVESIRWWWR